MCIFFKNCLFFFLPPHKVDGDLPESFASKEEYRKVHWGVHNLERCIDNKYFILLFPFDILFNSCFQSSLPFSYHNWVSKFRIGYMYGKKPRSPTIRSWTALVMYMNQIGVLSLPAMIELHNVFFSYKLESWCFSCSLLNLEFKVNLFPCNRGWSGCSPPHKCWRLSWWRCCWPWCRWWWPQ